ncbi:MAG TPA: lipid A deacylase LpxR family protein [Chitinophagaceae bacterium]
MGLRSIIPVLVMMALSQSLFAQRAPGHYSKEISFTTENDNYLLQKRDGYYTNGFYFSFQHLAGIKKRSAGKVIMRYELGQMIFNPYKYSITDPEQMDRPFAGYLFVKASRSGFFSNEANLQYGLSAGILGKPSGAEQTQRVYHDLINIYKVEGWDYQLKDEFGLNIHAQYTHPVTGELRRGSGLDLNAIVKASAGNTFTNGVAGLLLRIGLLEKPSQSVAWSSRLHREQAGYFRKSEFFIFYQPEVMLQVYNATLQGGLFRSDKGPVRAELQPWLYQHRMGLMFAQDRCSIIFAVVHRTREARGMRRKENYGSVQLAYRFY